MTYFEILLVILTDGDTKVPDVMEKHDNVDSIGQERKKESE